MPSMGGRRVGEPTLEETKTRVRDAHTALAREARLAELSGLYYVTIELPEAKAISAFLEIFAYD